MSVVALSLDSVDIDYVEARLDRLPRLRELFSRAAVRRLDSDADLMSATAWPTFYTATPPGEHGQYYPMQWDAAGMRLRHVGPEWLDSEPFWRPLARDGVPVTTLDVQCVFPARTPDGTELVNWGVDHYGGFHCNRPEVAREVSRRFGRYAMGFDAPVDKSGARLAEIRRQLLDSVRARGELVRWLMRREPSRLFLAVLQEGHRAGHYFWPHGDGTGDDGAADTLLEVHRALDAEVGRILDLVDLRTTTVVVFSLMGMTRNRSQMHFLPAVVERVNAAFGAGGAVPRRNVMRGLRERLPPGLQERIARAMPEPVRDWVTSRAYAGGLDWRRTPAIGLPTGGEGYVRLNLAGRETQGCLPRGGAAHRRYVEALVEGLTSLRVTATDEPLVDEVTFVGDRFPGPRSDNLPDLVVGWRPDAPATEVRSARLGTFTGRLATGRPGTHRGTAFAAIAGAAAATPPVARIRTTIDLAAFVRDLLVDRADDRLSSAAPGQC